MAGSLNALALLLLMAERRLIALVSTSSLGNCVSLDDADVAFVVLALREKTGMRGRIRVWLWQTPLCASKSDVLIDYCECFLHERRKLTRQVAKL